MAEIIIDVIARAVTVDGQPVSLTVTQFDVMTYLARHPKAVRSRDDLRAAIDRDEDCSDGAISSLIKHIRRAGFKHAIRTYYGLGWAWTDARPKFVNVDPTPPSQEDRDTLALRTEPCQTIDHADAALAALAHPYLKSGWRLTSWHLSWPSEADAAHGTAVLCRAT